ncbi:MAG: 2Fe-2S iron-sulfur cluster binding domain-containing protein [Candidatus Auribacterota bacterium]
MGLTLVSIFIVSSFSAALAAILVIAERVIANYGECTITINKDKHITLKGGCSLLEALTSEKIFIPSACGGKGTCGYCKVTVNEGAGQLLPTEEPYLSPEERKNNVRLSCQVKVRNDMDISIPEELLSVREYSCELVDIKDLTYDIKQFRMKLIEPTDMSFIPGQYLQLFTPKYDGNTEEVYRAYSISSDPKDKGYAETIIRLVPGGICTTYYFQYMKKGNKVKLNGPYGEFRMSNTNAKMICIAGGSGMAPIKCILHHMKNTGSTREAVYYFGGNTEKDLFLLDEMKQFEKDLANFSFVPVVAKPEQGWNGEKGLVTEAVLRNEKDLSKAEAYLCGSPGMIDASIVVLKNLGMPEANIFYDKFS